MLLNQILMSLIKVHNFIMIFVQLLQIQMELMFQLKIEEKIIIQIFLYVKKDVHMMVLIN